MNIPNKKIVIDYEIIGEDRIFIKKIDALTRAKLPKQYRLSVCSFLHLLGGDLYIDRKSYTYCKEDQHNIFLSRNICYGKMDLMQKFKIIEEYAKTLHNFNHSKKEEKQVIL